VNILVTNPYHPDSLLDLQKKFTVTQAHNKSEFINLLPNATAILIRSKTKIDSKLLITAKKLKYITTATSGLDHIDLNYCEQNNIEVFNPKEINSISAAEHSFALLLALAKKICTSEKLVKSHKWRDGLDRGIDLSGKTIGLIGIGRVGTKVARMAQSFNMTVQAYDPYKTPEHFRSHNINSNSTLEELIKTSDVISIHTPLTNETKYILNMNNLKLAKPNVILINTSRGKCINEMDLIQSLKNNIIKAAGLDVFENEPLSQESLLTQLDNVLLSPHTGAYTEEAFKNASFECTQWLQAKLNLINS